jgi:hypothetical protein
MSEKYEGGLSPQTAPLEENTNAQQLGASSDRGPPLSRQELNTNSAVGASQLRSEITAGGHRTLLDAPEPDVKPLPDQLELSLAGGSPDRRRRRSRRRQPRLPEPDVEPLLDLWPSKC